MQGRLEQSIADYRAVLQLDPEFALSHAALGIALFQTQRYRAELESIQRALELDPELPAAAALHLLVGRAWGELGDSVAAAEQYERALGIEPGNPEALDHLAGARFGQRRFEDTLALYRVLLEINPDSALTHTNVGATL